MTEILGKTKEEKPMWASKTVWISALTALAPIVYPPAAIWIAAQPEVFSALIGLVFTGLRFITVAPVKKPAPIKKA